MDNSVRAEDCVNRFLCKTYWRLGMCHRQCMVTTVWRRINPLQQLLLLCPKFTTRHQPVMGVLLLRPCVSSSLNSLSEFSAELHYTDTGSEHRLRTPPTDELTTILQLVVQQITTSGQKFDTSQHLDMSRCWARLRCGCGKYVVELL